MSRFHTAALLALIALAPAAAQEKAPPATYEKDVLPIPRKHCLGCHGPDRARGELDASTYAALMAGGRSGKVVLAGKPSESLLYLLPAHVEAPKMPPNVPRIPQTDLAVFKAWIEGGLVEKS